jgi:hypothetical protein
MTTTASRPRRRLWRAVAVTVTGTVLAALVGPRGPLGGFWAPAPEIPPPRGALLAGFVGENLVENVAFGLGLAVLIIGRRWFVERTTSPGRATAAWLASAWLLGSWMPHAALHLHIGLRPNALLAVEWVFHGGAIVAIVVLLWAMLGPRTIEGAGNAAPSLPHASEGEQPIERRS